VERGEPQGVVREFLTSLHFINVELAMAEVCAVCPNLATGRTARGTGKVISTDLRERGERTKGGIIDWVLIPVDPPRTITR